MLTASRRMRPCRRLWRLHCAGQSPIGGAGECLGLQAHLLEKMGTYRLRAKRAYPQLWRRKFCARRAPAGGDGYFFMPPARLFIEVVTASSLK